MTNGLFKEDLNITINRKAVEYDYILIISPVVPHETMGFAGGNKYFFPGIGGLDVIQTFHWLGAIITNPVVNGVKAGGCLQGMAMGISTMAISGPCRTRTYDPQIMSLLL